jgi:tripartite-type tricarboxylate transporter receptor subunit TctC
MNACSRVWRLRTALGAAALILVAPGLASAQNHFYAGKTITVIQGTEAGGSSDMLTRAVLPYVKKYVPGEPTVVSEYMPGAGGLKAVNHIYKNVRPDGLTVGRAGGALVTNAVLGEKGVLYDINKLIYLGSPHRTYHWVFITRREAGLKTIESLQSASGLRIGAQAVGHSNYFVGRLFALLIGIKDPKMIVGYGGAELDLALTKGEIDGRINNADTMLTRNADMLAKGAIDVHAIMEVPRGLKHEKFSSLPEITAFAKSEKERKLLDMVSAFRQFGSPFFLPPGTPKEQVKILQDAMVKAFNDPDFHKDYKKYTGDEASPLMPDEMEKLVREMPRDAEIVELFKKLNAAGPLPAR